jgi:hypothetical protein
MVALLLDGDAGGNGAEAQIPASAAAAAAGSASAVADVWPSDDAAGSASWDVVQEVFAAPAHWQRVKECIALSPTQQQQLQKLWSGLQATHASFAGRRAQLMQDLGVLSSSTAGVGLLGMPYPTCYAGEGAAAATDELLQGVDDSMAADYGVLLETSKLLWGDEVRCGV